MNEGMVLLLQKWVMGRREAYANELSTLCGSEKQKRLELLNA